LKDYRDCWVVCFKGKYRCLSCKRARKKCAFLKKVAQELPALPAHKKRRTDSSVKPTRGEYSLFDVATFY
jgi:hypothetical protein